MPRNDNHGNANFQLDKSQDVSCQAKEKRESDSSSNEVITGEP